MDFIIYTICFGILAAAFSLIISRSPVQAVLILVLAFLKTTVLFFAYGAEFLGILLITVYIGAIAILFLFVVMLLNLRIVELYSAVKYHIPIGAFVGILFILILLIVCLHDFKIFKFPSEDSKYSFDTWINLVFVEHNLNLLGETFYNYYWDIFFLITLLLLVAMLGVILLAVDFDYREKRLNRDLVFDESVRQTKENLVWLNMQVYGRDIKNSHVRESKIAKEVTAKIQAELYKDTWWQKKIKDLLD